MKIKILKATVCGGKGVKKGATVTASDRDVRFLIATGKAEAVKAKAKEKKDKNDKAIKTEDLETR